MLVFFALGNAKVLSFALGDAKVPNARSFAFWWNIGFGRTNMMFGHPLVSGDRGGGGGGGGGVRNAPK